MEAEEKAKGKSRMEERRRGQRRLRRKRTCSEVNGEQQKNETGTCCQELDFNDPHGFLSMQDILGCCDPREVQVTAALKLKGSKTQHTSKATAKPCKELQECMRPCK